MNTGASSDEHDDDSDDDQDEEDNDEGDETTNSQESSNSESDDAKLPKAATGDDNNVDQHKQSYFICNLISFCCWFVSLKEAISFLFVYLLIHYFSTILKVYYVIFQIYFFTSYSHFIMNVSREVPISNKYVAMDIQSTKPMKKKKCHGNRKAQHLRRRMRRQQQNQV